MKKDVEEANEITSQVKTSKTLPSSQINDSLEFATKSPKKSKWSKIARNIGQSESIFQSIFLCEDKKGSL